MCTAIPDLASAEQLIAKRCLYYIHYNENILN